ncbi:hypothetical protein V8E53_008659 [Lactarius tabidus]
MTSSALSAPALASVPSPSEDPQMLAGEPARKRHIQGHIITLALINTTPDPTPFTQTSSELKSPALTEIVLDVLEYTELPPNA